MEEWVMSSSLGTERGLPGGLLHYCLNQIGWFKITFLGEVEIAVTLGIKSWFAEVGLSTSDSIWDLFLLFLAVYTRECLYDLAIRNDFKAQKFQNIKSWINLITN